MKPSSSLLAFAFIGASTAFPPKASVTGQIWTLAPTQASNVTTAEPMFSILPVDPEATASDNGKPWRSRHTGLPTEVLKGVVKATAGSVDGNAMPNAAASVWKDTSAPPELEMDTKPTCHELHGPVGEGYSCYWHSPCWQGPSGSLWCDWHLSPQNQKHSGRSDLHRPWTEPTCNWGPDHRVWCDWQVTCDPKPADGDLCEWDFVKPAPMPMSLLSPPQPTVTHKQANTDASYDITTDSTLTYATRSASTTMKSSTFAPVAIVI